jgi:hypothetical protein
MKMVKSLAIALIATGIVASTALASATVWFEATGTNANSTTLTQGAAGGSTSLVCLNLGGVTCQWNVSVMLTNTGSNLFGYDLRLNGGTPGKLSASNLVLNNIGLPANDVATAGAAPDLVAMGQSSISTSTAPGNYTMATFTLTKVKDAGDTNTDSVFASIGGYGWGDDSGYGVPDVRAGGNDFAYGGAGTAFQNAVITIQNIPEPSTIGLLALGVLGMIRRRR